MDLARYAPEEVNDDEKKQNMFKKGLNPELRTLLTPQIYHNIRSFGKEEGTKPKHLELYFYDDEASLEHRYRKCCEECLQRDREVIEKLVGILRDNPYSQHLRSVGQIDDLDDYYVALNLDQWLD